MAWLSPLWGASHEKGQFTAPTGTLSGVSPQVFGVCFLWAKCLSENKDTDFCLFGARYQPGLSYEQPQCCPEKAAVGPCGSAASKSKSQAAVLRGQGLSLRMLVSPAALPTQQSSSLVSFLVGFLGESSALCPLGRAPGVRRWSKYDVRGQRSYVALAYACHCPKP